MDDEVRLWLNRAGVDRIFPRRALELFGHNGRMHILNDEFSLYSFLRDMGFKDVYIQIFSSWQISSRMFDTILIDIDEHSKASMDKLYSSVWKKYLRVLDSLDDANIKVSRVYATGRGLHVYIDFPVLNIEFYRKVCKAFAKDIGIFDFVDTNVLGDFTRNARLVGTYNTKANLFKVVRIAKDIDYTDLLNGEYGKPKYCVNDDLFDILFSYDDMFYRTIHHREKVENDSIVDVDFWKRHKNDMNMLPMCIRDGMEMLLKTGELSHYWRLIVALFLLRSWGYYETMQFFTNAYDYDYSKTKYQLDYIVDNRLSEYSCRKINDEFGLCPFFGRQEECPFYPNMNKFLPSWDKLLEGEDDDKSSE